MPKQYCKHLNLGIQVTQFPMVCPELENYEGLVLILCGDTPLVREETLKEFVEFHKSQKLGYHCYEYYF